MPSKKVLEEKQQVVTDLAEQLKKSCVGVVVDYKGISVADDTKLRKELRESGDQYKVVKNTLLKLALKEAGIEGLDPVLEGTTAVALSDKDYIHAAKTLYTFEKNTKGATLKVKAGFIDGKVLSKDDVAQQRGTGCESTGKPQCSDYRICYRVERNNERSCSCTECDCRKAGRRSIIRPL